MMRGVLSGFIWGVVVVGGVLAVASLLAPLPATVSPQTEAAAGTEGQTNGEAANAPVAGGVTDADVSDAASADVAEPAGEDQPVLSSTDSAPKPETSEAETSLQAPDVSQDGGALAVEGDSPVLPNPQAPSPDAPTQDTELSISVTPPQPQAPVEGESSAFPTGQQDNDGALSVTEPAPTPEAEDVTPQAEEIAEDGSSGEEQTSMLKPAGELGESFAQRTSTRLPSVGDEAEDTAQTPGGNSSKPIVENAQPFENVGGKPVMSIVLIDEGKPVNLEALAGFPYPLSIAVSTLDPDVAAKAAQYRSQGMEVLAMIDMPAGAGASDVEVAMQAHLSVSDDFVGIMEGVGDGLQGAKVVSDQVADVALNEGYGLVLFSQGLNTAQKLAAKEGVPSASVFRDFDGKGQTTVVIRRFLDQAAFKAPQESGVVMVGRLREETISALVLWGLQDRAGTVALAPVSVALTSQN
ncbi:Divergent polysaccharide deacetylase [Shimia sp. SK013]|uniref:divergent polysaccharide deacteylase family protein n=1 Tax=Shimia sp. SK013 TaxID=1389006 RepID=UPI0006B4DE9A|nr:divergent polysaccharide deacetylase family protein [Shimia sp. SK013]KPA22354.1 Divergent polysaccharide deacetylase [Shimia sp. SK013]